MINCSQLAEHLTEKFGLPVGAEGKNTPDGYQVTVSPLDVERTVSFSVEIVLGWRSVAVKFLPANFASKLVAAMEGATPEQWSASLVFSQSVIDKGGDLEIQISGVTVDPLDPSAWPSGWTSVSMSLRKSSVVIDSKDENSIYNTAFPWIARLYGIAIALLPLKEEPRQSVLELEEEGAEFEVGTKRYERSKVNRAACIEIHGLSCSVCDLNFEKVYGELGEGFIHVHHILPVSMMGGSYTVDPGKDLVPVCPNCHAMLHRESPPLSIDRLVRIIRGSN